MPRQRGRGEHVVDAPADAAFERVFDAVVEERVQLLAGVVDAQQIDDQRRAEFREEVAQFLDETDVVLFVGGIGDVQFGGGDVEVPGPEQFFVLARGDQRGGTAQEFFLAS